jgi:pSer/pThr/pTyr-binding forkhead associated (FHA) protein
MDGTIKGNSNLGERLNKLPKKETCFLIFEDKKIPLATKITIGRSDTNDIIIDDTLVSRFHAVIQKIDKDYFIKDLNSTNGTIVNNETVPKDKYIKLNCDDVISIGRTKLNFK